MKRSLLLSGATVGGLGAALVAIHPLYGAEASQSSSLVISKVASPTPTSTARTATPKPKSKSIKPKRKPTSVRKTLLGTPVVKKVSGTFTGDVVDIIYGLVQVQITVLNGKLTDAQALQAPSGRSYRYSQYALPILRDQTLAVQGLNIDGATGASYTSYGWYTSLQSALSRAGL